MKIHFTYGPFCMSRVIDFTALETSKRGLTGSEGSCLQYAHQMAERGHEVSLDVYYKGGEDETFDWGGVRVRTLVEVPEVVGEGADVVCAWNEPDILRRVPAPTVRYVNQQLNDFNYVQSRDFIQHVDLLSSPSEHHLAFLRGLGNLNVPTAIVANGCAPSDYEGAVKVPGRVLWASSADRGLHVLLEAWPAIRRAVARAHLRCLYEFNYDGLRGVEDRVDIDNDPKEIANRARYIRYGMDRLRDQGVEHVGSVSRVQMVEEMGAAEVLAYPCETLRYTEGFSVSTLEACAAGAIPVIGATDALPSLYGEAAVVVPSPPSEHLTEYACQVVRALVDPGWAAERRARCLELARGYAWPLLAERFEQRLEGAVKAGRRNPGSGS